MPTVQKEVVIGIPEGQDGDFNQTVLIPNEKIFD
jgi:hypothetical protein